MKSNTKPILILIFFALLLSSLAAISTESNSGLQIAMLYLTESTMLEEVLTEITNYDVEVLAFQRQQHVDNKTITDGFYLTSEDRAKMRTENYAIQERYWQSYEVALADLSQAASLDTSNVSDTQEAAALQEHIATLDKMGENFLIAKDCWVDHTCPDVDVVSLLILGDNTVLSRLDSPLIKQVDIKSLKNEIYANTPMPLATSFAYESWVPNRGTIYIYPSVIQGERYVENRMRWDTASRLSAFDWYSTYEHDFLLNDSNNSGYGPGTYLSDAQDYLSVPIVSHWVSDLPRPYLDTRFGDPDYVTDPCIIT